MTLNESKAERILGVFFFVFGAVLLLFIIPSQIAYVQGAYPQPRFFPQVIACLFMILGVALFVGGWRKKGSANQETYSFQWKELRLVLLTLGIVALYVLLLNWIPYIPATIIVLAVLIILYGQRNKFKIIGVSILLPIIIYVALTYGLQLRLP
jgi:hypothetical protein